MIRAALGRGVEFVTERSRATLLVMVLLSAVVLAGIPQIQTESQAGSSSDQFEDIEEVEKANYIAAQYTTGEERSNRTVGTVYVRDDDGNVLSQDSLLAGLRYQQALRENESVRQSLHEDGIVGISNMVALQAAGDRNASLDEQIRALDDASPERVEQLVARTVANDTRAQRFLPANHGSSQTTATDRRMLVTMNTTTNLSVMDGADRAMYDAALERSDAGFFVINQYAFDDYQSHFLGQMYELVLPIALLLILVILAFAYRDLVDVVVGMVGVLLSIAWMFGLLGWLGVAAGTVIIVPVVLITGLSIDFGFHVFNRYREQRGDDEDIRKPMARGVVLVATALVLVTVTAAIGFLANLTNPLPVIRDLGVAITAGVVSAFFIFLTVVPALKISVDGLFERFGFDRHKQALGHGRYLRPTLARSVTLARKFAPAVLVVAVLVGAAGGLAWTALEEEQFQQPDGEVAEWKQQIPGPLGWQVADNSPPKQLDHVEEVYRPASASDAIQEQILVEDDVTSATTLENVSDGANYYDQQGILVEDTDRPSVRSPVTAMQALAQRNETFAAAYQRADTDGNGVPDRNLTRLYDRFYAADNATAAQVIERRGGEYRSLLVTVSLNTGYSQPEETVGTLNEGADRMEGDGTRTATAAGPIAVNTAILDEIVGGILLTMIIALLAILLTMTGVFYYMHGSASLGVVVAVPIALVIGLVVGGMYLLEIPLTLLTALLMSLVIGLGVDYNIHIGDRFADELRDGKSEFEALDAAVTGTGGALLGSTLTSTSAFATIALVPHPQLQSFSSIVVIALTTSFLASVLVLPSLLVLWHRYVPGEVTTADAGDDAIPQD